MLSTLTSFLVVSDEKLRSKDHAICTHFYACYWVEEEAAVVHVTAVACAKRNQKNILKRMDTEQVLCEMKHLRNEVLFFAQNWEGGAIGRNRLPFFVAKAGINIMGLCHDLISDGNGRLGYVHKKPHNVYYVVNT